MTAVRVFLFVMVVLAALLGSLRWDDRERRIR
jgi:hypothetical protein